MKRSLNAELRRLKSLLAKRKKDGRQQSPSAYLLLPNSTGLPELPVAEQLAAGQVVCYFQNLDLPPSFDEGLPPPPPPTLQLPAIDVDNSITPSEIDPS